VTEKFLKTKSFDFSLACIRSICQEAQCEAEYEHILAKCPDSVINQIDSEAPSAKFIGKGRAVALHFLLGLQLSGERVDVISKTLSILPAHVLKELLQSTGIFKSKSQTHRLERQLLDKYDVFVTEWLQVRLHRHDGVVSVLILFDDDFTRYIPMQKLCFP
jgi:hypothetical protein